LLSIGIFDTILLISSAILKIPAISYIIQNLLNKSSDLTGRLDIYTRIFIIMKDSPLWGVGRDNNYAYSLQYALAGNVQNGLLDSIVSFGIIGTAFMLVILVLSIKKGKKRDNLAFKAYLFVFIVLSMVEVTFRLYFLVLLAMIAFGSEKVNQKSLHQHNLGVLK
ncbi:MAG: O-antigen ligase family protein, partial [Ruminococcus sp.]|nr:O-antigen ligase family protein [Ruminococcus sp.]